MSLPFFALPTDLTPRLIYVDDELLVVEKPSGLLSVPGRGDDKQDCLIARLHALGYPLARIVHRLDFDTSGLLVVAQNADSHRELSRQFHDREVTKHYTALALGAIAQPQGEITFPLIYDPENKPRHKVDYVEGQSALTEYNVVNQQESFARVDLIPHTGRTHQLRVHMQALGHPLLGDSLYAPEHAFNRESRLCLHAERLSFTHPLHHGRLSFYAPAPF